MKLILEPSRHQKGEKHPYSKVTIEHPHDDLAIEDVMGLVINALQTWGFNRSSIADYLDDEFVKSLDLIDWSEETQRSFEGRGIS